MTATGSKTAGTRTKLQTTCHVFGIKDLFIYRITGGIDNRSGCHFGEGKVNRLIITGQGIEGVTIKLGRQHQMGSDISVMVGLGTHQNIAVTGRTVCADMQSGSSLLPTPAVLLNLTDTTVTKRKTEGINDINIPPVVLHIERAILTAGDRVMPIVLGRLMGHTVRIRYTRHAGVGDEFK